MKSNYWLNWAVRLIAAIIFLQTLYFKFSGAPESVYIFETLGVEPYGRIGSGISELIASILLLIPRTAGWGALLGFGIICGAILSHLTILGIDVQEDGGTLFVLAIVVLVCTGIAILLNRKQIPILKHIGQQRA